MKTAVAPPNACPPHFVKHAFETSFQLACPKEVAWTWLNTPEIFVDGQVWPFRVEFIAPALGLKAGFEVGGLNIHHGPLMLFAGQLTEIRPGEYRSLHYFYGSYVLSLRLVRPTCLEFWVTADGPTSSTVRLRVSSYTHRRFARGWTFLQKLFWKRFPRWMAFALDVERPRDRSSASPAAPMEWG
jgi:hypothetical protein